MEFMQVSILEVKLNLFKIVAFLNMKAGLAGKFFEATFVANGQMNTVL